MFFVLALYNFMNYGILTSTVAILEFKETKKQQQQNII